MEMITVNKTALDKALEKATTLGLAQLKAQAEAGQSRFLVHYDCPNYSDGWKVLEALELRGVKCCESGFGSNKKYDGSWEFHVTMKIV